MVRQILSQTVGCGVGVCLSAACLFAQQPPAEQAGERIYAQVSESVFLIQVTDAAGQQTGTATGFLVGPDLVLSNAHVARAGTMAVRIGSLEVPCPVERVDVVNDLALCRMQAKSGAVPLKVSLEEPKPGTSVYAIGNPHGLERTISQGLFTGYRDRDGRQVAQISAALSPGSSGGPVLNAQGDLVGVAVSSLVEGQNLNFAVSLSAVRSFLTNESPAPSASSLLDAARSLENDENALTSADDEWKTTEAQVHDLLLRAIDSTSDRTLLEAIYDNATVFRSDVQVGAARKLLTLVKAPDRDLYRRLGEALYYATDHVGPSPQLDEAEKAVARAVELGHPVRPEDLLLLGKIQRQAERALEAYETLQRASAIVKGGTAEALETYYALFQAADELGRSSEAGAWFERAKREGILPYQMALFADYFEKHLRYADAAAAYSAAFAALPGSYSYVCSAGRDYWIADQFDDSLAAERTCIELATPRKGTDASIAFAHRAIADILNGRNVYDEAASHAKEAIQIEPNDAWAHEFLAEALQGQRRFTEAVASARTALRLSDGKFSQMHFVLGRALFELHQYAEATQAFQKAAELDPKNPSAAYNVAVSLYNDNLLNDALPWYREVLRRDPSYGKKDQVSQMIEMLSQRSPLQQ